MTSFGGILYLIDMALFVGLLPYSFVIYFDMRHWRKKGVPVLPGLTACLFLLSCPAIYFGILFLIGLIWHNPNPVVIEIFGFIVPAIYYVVYFFMRARYLKIATESRPTLPADTWWSTLLFILALLPVLMILMYLGLAGPR
ncbi:MAG: hypothetical protein Q7S28_02480 [bacterium]|nr:hypothetical protein [bacterium]